MSDKSVEAKAVYEGVAQALNTLPTAGNSGAISVGFASEDALKGMKDMLLGIFRDSLFKKIEEQEIIDKKNAQETKEALKKTSETITNAINNEATKNAQETDKIIKSLEKQGFSLKKAIESFGLETLDYVGGVLKTFTKDVADATKLMQKLNQSGMVVAGGFESIARSASKAGIEYDKYAEYLKTNSQTFAKLNAVGINGIKSFQSSLAELDDMKLGLSKEDQVAIYKSVISRYDPTELARIGQAGLNEEVKKTAQVMVNLRKVTGQSIETITEEQKLKASNLRTQIWNAKNPNSAAGLKALGVDTNDTDIMDYIGSGGTRISARMAMMLSNSETMRRMMPEIIARSRNDSLTNDIALQMREKYKKSAENDIKHYKEEMNDATYNASGASSTFENRWAPYTLLSTLASTGNSKLSPELEKSYNEQKEQVNLANEVGKNISRLKNQKAILETGGDKGINSTLSAASSVLNGAANKLDTLIEKFTDKDGKLMGGLATAIGVSFAKELAKKGLVWAGSATTSLVDGSRGNSKSLFGEIAEEVAGEAIGNIASKKIAKNAIVKKGLTKVKSFAKKGLTKVKSSPLKTVGVLAAIDTGIEGAGLLSDVSNGNVLMSSAKARMEQNEYAKEVVDNWREGNYGSSAYAFGKIILHNMMNIGDTIRNIGSLWDKNDSTINIEKVKQQFINENKIIDMADMNEKFEAMINLLREANMLNKGNLDMAIKERTDYLLKPSMTKIEQ